MKNNIEWCYYSFIVHIAAAHLKYDHAYYAKLIEYGAIAYFQSIVNQITMDYVIGQSKLKYNYIHTQYVLPIVKLLIIKSDIMETVNMYETIVVKKTSVTNSTISLLLRCLIFLTILFSLHYKCSVQNSVKVIMQNSCLKSNDGCY